MHELKHFSCKRTCSGFAVCDLDFVGLSSYILVFLLRYESKNVSHLYTVWNADKVTAVWRWLSLFLLWLSWISLSLSLSLKCTRNLLLSAQECFPTLLYPTILFSFSHPIPSRLQTLTFPLPFLPPSVLLCHERRYFLFIFQKQESCVPSFFNILL